MIMAAYAAVLVVALLMIAFSVWTPQGRRP
jgi:hypothetical protein